MNEKSLQTLELHKVLDQLASYCTFSAGVDLARELFPSTSFDEASTWQRETAEARLLLKNRQNISMGGARDVRDAALQATQTAIEANITQLQQLLIDPQANLAELRRFPMIEDLSVCQTCQFRELCGRKK